MQIQPPRLSRGKNREDTQISFERQSTNESTSKRIKCTDRIYQNASMDGPGDSARSCDETFHLRTLSLFISVLHSHHKKGKRRESSAGRSKCGKDRDTLGVSGASKWAVTSLNRGLCGPHTLWAFLFQPPWRTRVTRLRRLKNSSGDLQPLPATQSFQITLAEDPPGSPIRPWRRPPGPGPSLFLLVSDSAGVPAGTCHRWPRPRPPPAGSPLLQQ